MPKPNATLSIIMFAILIGCNGAMHTMGDPESDHVPLADPILAVGHGAIISTEGARIDTSPSFVIAAQRYYLKDLHRKSSDTQRRAFEELRQQLDDVKSQTPSEAILLNAVMLAWLIEAVAPENAPHLMSRNTALLDRIIRLNGRAPELRDRYAGAARTEFVERLRQDGHLAFLSATTAGGEQYITECREAGVPIPPDWGSAQWKSKGVLTVDFLGSPKSEVFVFESESPRGVCMALPRSSGNTNWITRHHLSRN